MPAIFGLCRTGFVTPSETFYAAIIQNVKTLDPTRRAHCYTHLNVGRNKPVRALSAGLAFPALRLPETPTLADAGRSYSGLHPAIKLRIDSPFSFRDKSARSGFALVRRVPDRIVRHD